LSSARSRALDKERVHSVCGNSFLSYSLTLSSYRAVAASTPSRRRRHAPALGRRHAHARRQRAAAATTAATSPRRALALAQPPRPRPPTAKVHAGKVHAADLKPPRPVVSPATRRLTRGPPSRPRPNLHGDCLLPFCDIVIKKLYILRV
jgi:hypothetical protein